MGEGGNGRENIECDHAWHVKEGSGTYLGAMEF